MPRIDKNGNMEFHPAELPSDYHPTSTDSDNPFFNQKEEPVIILSRSCKTCGAMFELHVDYDPDNPAHDLCDDCLLALPKDPNQHYPELTIQAEMEAGAKTCDEDL